MFDWDRIRDTLQDAAPDIGMTVVVVLVAAIVWVLFVRVGRRAANKAARRDHHDGETAAAERAQRVKTLWTVTRSVALAALLSIVLLTIMAIWGIPIGPFVAVGGVIGIALGFGAQDVVRDFIAGFLIVAEDQFSLGDVVTIGGVTGEVQAIQLRVTVLRDSEGNVHYVPNGRIGVATNFTQEFSSAVIDVSVAYKENVDRVMEVLQDEMGQLRRDPEWESIVVEEPEILGVNSLEASSVDIRVKFTTAPGDQWKVRREFLRRIKGRFDAEGIEIPFPHVTVTRGPSDEITDAGGALQERRVQE